MHGRACDWGGAGAQVTGMPYDQVLGLIKQSRPAGPTELGFVRPPPPGAGAESPKEDEL